MSKNARTTYCQFSSILDSAYRHNISFGKILKLLFRNYLEPFSWFPGGLDNGNLVYFLPVDLFLSYSLSLGSIQELAVPSCKSLSSSVHPSGVYWVDLDSGSHDNAFKVYCDMETDGRGWTLVWSYTFTDYIPFTAVTNAVSPRPNWPSGKPDVNVPISTTTPLNEQDYNASEFSLWKQFGSEMLIKSNINNWLVCSPGSGSLVGVR